MTENEFDKLWQQAEVESYSQRLAAEYPGWRRKQQRTIGMVTASLAVVVLLGLVLVLVLVAQLQQPQDFEKVYCNRVGTTDAQWASLAAEILME